MPRATQDAAGSPNVSFGAVTRTLQEAAAALERDVPELLAEWTAITAEEPWLSLPAEHRLNSIPIVVENLIRVALGGGEDRRSLVIASGIEHGESRRSTGMPYELIMTEYYLLREAMWRRVQRVLPAELRAPAILRIDRTITVSQRAALLGYHRRELEASGRWVNSLNSLAEELPPHCV